METISYKITLFSYWHCGSGLAAGADVDALVITDKDGLPFIPGKTIKGLIHEAFDDLCEFNSLNRSSYANHFFGTQSTQGSAFFSNATLVSNEREAIIINKYQDYLFKTIASTAIDETTGTAKKLSLRKIQVTVPCVLYGKISDESDDNDKNKIRQLIIESLGLIKRMGLDRNRGLGRCQFEIIKGGTTNE
jgi:CRISPR/Cas system CMR subunit Cmr6 (Cas7 group RAMP superfamily)